MKKEAHVNSVTIKITGEQSTWDQINTTIGATGSTPGVCSESSNNPLDKTRKHNENCNIQPKDRKPRQSNL